MKLKTGCCGGNITLFLVTNRRGFLTDLNFGANERNIISTARKGILKSVNLLKSLVAKCYKTRKILLCKDCKSVFIYLYYAREGFSFPSILLQMWLVCAIAQIYSKHSYLARLYFSYFTIFCNQTLQFY